MDGIKRSLTGKQPDYVRGFLDALRAVGRLSDQDVGTLLSWVTEANIRRVVSGPVAEPRPAAEL